MFSFAPGASGANCPPERVDLRATVAHVHDGDTLRLADGRDVRLVGINTPELGRDGSPDEPLAAAARRALIELLGDDDPTVHLEFAPERTDRYDRLLAHVYTRDGRSVTAALLARGLGWRVAIPPNLGHLDCYREAEARAQAADRGVHAEAAYRPVPARSLGAERGGFLRAQGRIVRVGESRNAYWLDLGGLTLRLAREDLPYFGTDDPRRWLDRRLRVRGWVYHVDGQPRMNLRHPAAVEWMSVPQ